MRARRGLGRGRSLVSGAILAVLLSSFSLALVTHVWTLSLHVPFQYAHSPSDDQEDATLDLMLIKNIHETGWFNTNPKLNAPFEQHWAEWPMGGDLLAYTVKKALVDTTGDVPLTFNVFWLLTFPFTALAAFPVLRSLRCSWATAIVGAVLFSLAPYHFRNGAAHENLAFYVGIPVIVLLCTKILGPDSALPSVAELRHRASWWRLRWLLLGAVLVGVTGIYYLAFLLSLLAICAVVSALAYRRPGRLVLAALFGGVGLATSFFANLPTLWYRWQHDPNLIGVATRLIRAQRGNVRWHQRHGRTARSYVSIVPPALTMGLDSHSAYAPASRISCAEIPPVPIILRRTIDLADRNLDAERGAGVAGISPDGIVDATGDDRL